MTIISSYDDLNNILTNFTFESIGFKMTDQDERFAEYIKNHQFRDNQYARLNKKNYEAEVYIGDKETLEGYARLGTFNLHRLDEVLFLLTYGLNELKVDKQVLDRYKSDIGYHQSDVVPSRQAKKY